MKIRILFLAVILISGQWLQGQSTLQVIRATSPRVTIREGTNVSEGGWRISPGIRPDVYKTSGENERITFITDLDSISFVMNPGKVFDFVILLNDKDSAFTRIMYKPGFLRVLKQGGTYNYEDQRPLNRFVYQSKNDPELKMVREEFRLDSVAGTGNEVSRMINILHWVHNTFPHDGSREVPPFKDITDLMINCIKDRGTMHCGALAWTLKACYLSMGFRARQVVCFPMDSTDFECHSIIAVYSDSGQKWLWMDPTNDAYVMNEQGELLSIAEVRERLVNDRPLILNPDANYNRKFSIEKPGYLYQYMAKNLYAFQCFSEVDGESISNVLLPVEWKGVFPRTAQNKPKYTNNPGLFWAKPE